VEKVAAKLGLPLLYIIFKKLPKVNTDIVVTLLATLEPIFLSPHRSDLSDAINHPL
jgi:hypothetical protein